MKKLLILFIALFSFISLTACGDSGGYLEYNTKYYRLSNGGSFANGDSGDDGVGICYMVFKRNGDVLGYQEFIKENTLEKVTIDSSDNYTYDSETETGTIYYDRGYGELVYDITFSEGRFVYRGDLFMTQEYYDNNIANQEDN